MGRHAGYIALAAGIAGGAEVILVPESTNDWQKLSDYFIRDKSKKAFSIVVVAEGDEEGGAYKIVDKLRLQIPDLDPRVSILGHIQRGGSPSAYDRVLASRLGCAAVEALLKGESNKMVGLINNQVALTSYDDAIHKTKELNADLLKLVDIFNT